MNAWMWSDVGFLLLAALSGTVFMVVYTYRTPWWVEEHRAHLGFFTLALTLILWTYVFRSTIPGPVFMVVRRLEFDAIALMMVWRVFLLFRSRRPDRARELREDEYRAGA